MDAEIKKGKSGEETADQLPDWIGRRNNEIDVEWSDFVVSTKPSKNSLVTEDVEAAEASKTLRWADGVLKLVGKDWVSSMSEFYVKLTEVDVYRYIVFVHFVMETPVAKAKDRKWVDTNFDFTLFTNTNAVVTGFSMPLDRGCGRYLVERQFLNSANVVYPVRNCSSANLRILYHTRVTWC